MQNIKHTYKENIKTAHELARELLAGPDLPIFHFDPSYVDASSVEENLTTSWVSVDIVDTIEDVSEEEINEAKQRVEDDGLEFVPQFIILAGTQDEQFDRKEPNHNVVDFPN